MQGTLSVSVTARSTNAWIANATIKLIQKNTNKLLTSKITTTDNVPISLDVAEKGPFLLTTSHPDYLSETKELSTISGTQNAAFSLERLTPQNSGKITANVVDEDGLNVDNAQVVLYDAASGFLYHAANPSITDVMNAGTGVPSGALVARAVKYQRDRTTPQTSPATEHSAQTKLHHDWTSAGTSCGENKDETLCRFPL